jgi:CHASE2 domain-containing sensor protein
LIKANQQKRNRIVALSFVSVLLLLMYGPLAQWFDSADRALYDQLAGGRPAKVLSNAYIVSINPKLKSNAEILRVRHARICAATTSLCRNIG